MIKKQDIVVLKKNQLFTSLDEKKIEELLHELQSQVYYYDRNDVIATVGTPCNALYIVLSGEVDIENFSDDGDSILIKKIMPAQSFGEMVAFSNKSVWPASAKASSKVKVISIDSSMIIETGNKIFISNFLSLLSNRAMFLNNRISYLVLKRTRARISKYLMNMYKMKQCREFKINLNREDMAKFLAITRPALSRELSRMKREGIIDYRKNEFHIKDIEKLSNY